MRNMELLKIIEEAEAVLFDMDGVIVDTDSLHREAKEGAIEACGIKIDETGIQDEFWHCTSAQIYQELSEKHPDIKLTQEEFAIRKSMIFAQIAPARIREIQGAFEFVNLLKEKGKKTALVTASRMDTLGLVASKFDLKKYFDVILSREDVENAKPDPEAYLKAAKLLSVEPGSCAVVEDSVLGIQSGKAAGCKVLGKMTSHSADTLLEAGADVVFENYSEIDRIFPLC